MIACTRLDARSPEMLSLSWAEHFSLDDFSVSALGSKHAASGESTERRAIEHVGGCVGAG